GSTAFSSVTGIARITITAVNDAPSFTKGPDVTTLEDGGPAPFLNWATNVLPYPAPPAPLATDEGAQAPKFLVTTDNNALFTAVGQPAIDASGTLTYTTVPNANGVAHVTVTLMDNGGTANGGVDTSAPQTFTINITPVNDQPSFAKGPDQTVLENAG